MVFLAILTSVAVTWLALVGEHLDGGKEEQEYRNGDEVPVIQRLNDLVHCGVP